MGSITIATMKIDRRCHHNIFIDSDGDGFGDPEQPNALCEAGDGMVPNDHDCDDNNALIFPSATEICDGIEMTAMTRLTKRHPLGPSTMMVMVMVRQTSPSQPALSRRLCRQPE